MKKTIVGVLLLGIAFFSANGALAHQKKPSGVPFTTLWNAIEELQERFDNRFHNGGGTQGPPGPAGPQGPRGITGAGNIAFVNSIASSTTTPVYVLTTNRKVWKYATSSWENLNRDVPTSTNAIVQWELNTFLDQVGNVWHWDGSAWKNITHP